MAETVLLGDGAHDGHCARRAGTATAELAGRGLLLVSERSVQKWGRESADSGRRRAREAASSPWRPWPGKGGLLSGFDALREDS